MGIQASKLLLAFYSPLTKRLPIFGLRDFNWTMKPPPLSKHLLPQVFPCYLPLPGGGPALYPLEGVILDREGAPLCHPIHLILWCHPSVVMTLCDQSWNPLISLKMPSTLTCIRQCRLQCDMSSSEKGVCTSFLGVPAPTQALPQQHQALPSWRHRQRRWFLTKPPDKSQIQLWPRITAEVNYSFRVNYVCPKQIKCNSNTNLLYF